MFISIFHGTVLDFYLLCSKEYHKSQMAYKRTNRCLYKSDFKSFIEAEPYSVLGHILNAFHGLALTTTDEAWLGEIQLLQKVLLPWKNEEAEIIFEYDIPRLGKRIDVVLLLRGIIFCLEFKVGQKDALQTDVEQVMDYALDLKNFHRYSHDRILSLKHITLSRRS